MEQEKEPNSAVSSPESVEKLTHAAQQLDPKVERRLLRKLDLHIVPILFLVYFCAFLDRINVGNALIEGIVEELDINSTIPSNIVLKRVAPSTWITILTFFFGLVTVCQGFVESPTCFVVCRFFLGVFEAGLLLVYYKRHELQKGFAVRFTSAMVGAVGGLLEFLLAKLDGVGGYSGWRWIFIVEGLMPISLNFLAKSLIVDWPSEATFLTERLMVAVRLKGDVGSSKMDRLVRQSLQIILKDWEISTRALIYFTITTSEYSTALFNPSTILNQFGYEASQAQVHSIPIWATSAAATILVGYLSDRIRHR
ncbi:hypothetical protein EMCG_08262 [[Emmonsia] crescens]|uniref:Major facilitator superfamily (MFS) profile domain-containing protein n=1 Tax=[Emmonsia] crescens TaxID=73230 RepID=A0A0G2I678_9EURO|nr:hypothetical protein EMCG_08262 [Emmonsia crescens UAMH 3008]